MIKITDKYYADNDKYNWILCKKHIEKDYIINNSFDLEIQNKINELVRVVNKINKQDTSKETNCMTD